nr:MAG TPA: hypothetical protein [Bacteriophage sp.]
MTIVSGPGCYTYLLYPAQEGGQNAKAERL